MAVGDPVGAVSAVTTAMTFQPAAGVVVALTCVACYNNWIKIIDGTNSGLFISNAAAPNEVKMIITNDTYLYLTSSSGQSSCYTGVQIK